MTPFSLQIPLLVAASLLPGISRVSAGTKGGNVHYHFQITDRPDQQRFVLTLRSTDKRPICIYRDKWPNGFGQLDFGSTWVTLHASEKLLPARDTNFGICGGDESCYMRILPGQELSGFIGYEQFGKPEEIAKLARRKLHFPVSPLVCVEWPPRRARPAPMEADTPLGRK